MGIQGRRICRCCTSCTLLIWLGTFGFLCRVGGCRDLKVRLDDLGFWPPKALKVFRDLGFRLPVYATAEAPARITTEAAMATRALHVAIMGDESLFLDLWKHIEMNGVPPYLCE